ncbi:beta-xylosidase [Kribbella sp. VKM Ac-2527]|uniref:Beta-xylosidase n=2 Tax=Kribbella caucasensis TaxID=2512215 RepID=A0A4R6J2Y4_9ACTN|nr:beta-xylosidase [Kribbella sp. VKM Ac-2527]
MSGYANPVLDADWPDPDVVRVGDDYYLVASSFNRAPGLPILHSRDLVSWEIVARALPQVPPVEHYRIPRHGSGVWAPSLRHHRGLFHLTYPDPDHGIFVLTAPDPGGPWSEPRPLLAGTGVIDPCPLWDDDGRAYVVFGWAHSRSGQMNRLSVVEVTEDLQDVVSTPRTVVAGDEIPGCRTLEGPKFYRRDGWYWIFAPAGGVATGWQSVFRSREVYGPYEHRVVLAQGSSPINGPHQGAWIDTPGGEHWFLHFQDRGVFGRVVHLQPMTWGEDGWPIIGAAPPGAMTGEPVPYYARPALGSPPAEQREPVRSDAFESTKLGLQWHWQANPEPNWHVLPGDGTLRLRLVPDDLGDLRRLGHVLGQPLPGQPSEWVTSARLGPAPDGARVGLVVLGTAYAWIGLMRTPGGLHVLCRRSMDGPGEQTLAQAGMPEGDDEVELRVRCDAEGLVTFAWRFSGGVEWQQVPSSFTAQPGRWIGADVGLFAAAPLGTPDGARTVSLTARDDTAAEATGGYATFHAVRVGIGSGEGRA